MFGKTTVSISKKDQPYTSKLRGVAALLGEVAPEAATQKAVAVTAIRLPPQRPRRDFDPDRLEQLVLSIKEHGILEPLLVRPRTGGDYELVAGERRLRAARELKLTEVPIVVRELDERQALQVALIENLQREDLNPVEETDAILTLLSLALSIEKNEVPALFYQAHSAKHRGQELTQNVLSQIQTIQEVIAGIGRFSMDSFRASRLP